MNESTKTPMASDQNRPLKGGFLAPLFDIRFETLVTPAAIRTIYLLGLGMVLVGSLSWVFNAPGFGALLWRILTFPIILILGFFLTRLVMELVMSVFKLLETQKNIENLLREQLGKPPRE